MSKPKIRFNGFTDDWEQRKVLNLGNIVTGSTPSTKDKSNYDGKFMFVSPADIQGNRYVTSTITTLTEKGFNQGRILKEKSTLFVSIGSTIGKVAQIFEKSTTNQQINAIEPYDYCNEDFVFTLMEKTSKQIKSLAATQAVPIVNKTTFGEVRINIPSDINEQKKIGEYFNRLDNLITLHQRKCNETKILKKYMLQNMFPDGDEKIPKIRFKGFTDDWEQRKLGDILNDMYNGQTPSRFRNDFWNGAISWLTSGELNRGTVYDSTEKITEAGRESANLRVVPKGSFVIAITGLEAAGTRGNCALLGFDTTLNQSCMALFPNKKIVTSEFLFQWYRKVGEEYGISYTQGTKQQSYNAELIKILPIALPIIDEQKKICKILFTLDNLITLHQRKCNELKNIKKYMLQNMFI